MAKRTPLDTKMKISIIVLSVVAIVRAGPVAQPEPHEEPVLRSVIGNLVNCGDSDLYLCFKEHALKAAERINAARKLDIIDGITIFNNNPRTARSFEPLPSDLEERKKQVAARLWESTSDLLENGELEISFGGDEEEESRDLGDVEEGRGKKKKKKGKKKLKMLMPLAMILKVKALIIIAIAVKIIAFSLFKLAIIAKIAFISKIFGMLKELLAKKKGGDDHHHEHEVVHDTYGPPSFDAGGPYARSMTEANDMAYSAYKQ